MIQVIGVVGAVLIALVAGSAGGYWIVDTFLVKANGYFRLGCVLAMFVAWVAVCAAFPVAVNALLESAG